MADRVETAASPDPSVLEWLTPPLRRWRLVLGVPIALAFVTAVVSLILPPVFTATTSFVPEAGDNQQLPSGLAGLAGQFGLSLGSSGGISPDFFAQVLTSRELLVAALQSRFTDPRDGVQRTLQEIIRPRGRTERERLDEAVRKLRDKVLVRFDRRSQIISLNVNARTAELAADVANRMVTLLNEFNLQRRQSRSREQRRFTGDRVANALRELREAEAAHLRFVSSNRRYGESPVLALEENRLQREVGTRQEVFTTLSREFEQAKIAEVRDTPVLTIIDRATPPDRRSFPQRKRMVMLAAFFGGLLGLAVVYAGEYRRVVARERGAGYQAFLDAWRTFVAEARALVPSRRAH